MSGRISEKAYLVKALPSGVRYSFVPHPEEPGHWLRTDVCVLLTACGACGSKLGEPCRSFSRRGYTASVHCDRRTSARHKEPPGYVQDGVAIEARFPSDEIVQLLVGALTERHGKRQ
jgi:hypothetical protein